MTWASMYYKSLINIFDGVKENDDYGDDNDQNIRKPVSIIIFIMSLFHWIGSSAAQWVCYPWLLDTSGKLPPVLVQGQLTLKCTEGLYIILCDIEKCIIWTILSYVLGPGKTVPNIYPCLPFTHYMKD